MKVISYSLFGDPSSFEFPFYLRGVYFNARMNHILYPEFINWIFVSRNILDYHGELLNDLLEFGNVDLTSIRDHKQRCQSMLWRMHPIFYNNVTHILCRDLDSVSTYREAMCVYDWLHSPYEFHAINDNAAHSGLMGGLVGFNCAKFRELTGYKSFDQMVSGCDFSKHGSDQNWMNKFVAPKIKNNLLFHNLKGQGAQAAAVKTEVPKMKDISEKLWTTDLISRYIGSAGVIDFELLRWFKANDPDPKFDEFERKYKEVFYWAR